MTDKEWKAFVDGNHGKYDYYNHPYVYVKKSAKVYDIKTFVKTPDAGKTAECNTFVELIPGLLISVAYRNNLWAFGYRYYIPSKGGAGHECSVWRENQTGDRIEELLWFIRRPKLISDKFLNELDRFVQIIKDARMESRQTELQFD